MDQETKKFIQEENEKLLKLLSEKINKTATKEEVMTIVKQSEEKIKGEIKKEVREIIEEEVGNLARMTKDEFDRMYEKLDEVSKVIREKMASFDDRIEKNKKSITGTREQCWRRDDSLVDDVIGTNERIDAIDKHLKIDSKKLAPSHP